MLLITTIPQRALMDDVLANTVYSMEKTLKNSHRLLPTMWFIQELWV